jgi:osmotically-inducible protein OsmY
MTDEQLQADVVAELFWDPKVDSEAIAVSADAGTVTLRGAVDSFRQKREAGKAARRVYGVIGVQNELDVRLLDDSKRDDAELRGDVLQALMLDSLIPTTVDARARNGSVTLSGTADWQYQRDEAEFLAAKRQSRSSARNQGVTRHWLRVPDVAHCGHGWDRNNLTGSDSFLGIAPASLPAAASIRSSHCYEE